MGLLDGLLGGGRRRGGGMMGGGMMGGGGGGMSPLTMALLGALALKGYQHRDQLGSMLGGVTGAGGGMGQGGYNQGGMGQAGMGQGGGGLFGGLGSLLGGGAAGGMGGGALSGGLGELMGRFQQSGHGEVADSWVGTGPNRGVAPNQLEESLGQDTIQNLMQQTGLPRDELLTRLSGVLPQAVDAMTPHGRLPTEQETSNWRLS